MFWSLFTIADKLSNTADKVFKASGKLSGYTYNLVIIPDKVFKPTHRAVKAMENIFTIAESVFVISDGL